jgi:hypothetical protein
MNISLFMFWSIVCIALVLHTHFVWNLVLNGLLQLSSAPLWDRVRSNYGPFPLFLACTCGELLYFVICWLIVVPIWVSWRQKQTMELWNLLVPENFKIAPDWRQQGNSVYMAFLLLMPNWLALCHFMSIIFALLSFNYWIFWGVSYHCWEITKPWYYEWLG